MGNTESHPDQAVDPHCSEQAVIDLTKDDERKGRLSETATWDIAPSKLRPSSAIKQGNNSKWKRHNAPTPHKLRGQSSGSNTTKRPHVLEKPLQAKRKKTSSPHSDLSVTLSTPPSENSDKDEATFLNSDTDLDETENNKVSEPSETALEPRDAKRLSTNVGMGAAKEGTGGDMAKQQLEETDSSDVPSGHEQKRRNDCCSKPTLVVVDDDMIDNEREASPSPSEKSDRGVSSVDMDPGEKVMETLAATNSAKPCTHEDDDSFATPRGEVATTESQVKTYKAPFIENADVLVEKRDANGAKSPRGSCDTEKGSVEGAKKVTVRDSSRTLEDEVSKAANVVEESSKGKIHDRNKTQPRSEVEASKDVHQNRTLLLAADTYGFLSQDGNIISSNVSLPMAGKDGSSEEAKRKRLRSNSSSKLAASADAKMSATTLSANRGRSRRRKKLNASANIRSADEIPGNTLQTPSITNGQLPSQNAALKFPSPNPSEDEEDDAFSFNRDHPPSPMNDKESHRKSLGNATETATSESDPFEFNPAEAVGFSKPSKFRRSITPSGGKKTYRDGSPQARPSPESSSPGKTTDLDKANERHTIEGVQTTRDLYPLANSEKELLNVTDPQSDTVMKRAAGSKLPRSRNGDETESSLESRVGAVQSITGCSTVEVAEENQNADDTKKISDDIGTSLDEAQKHALAVTLQESKGADRTGFLHSDGDATDNASEEAAVQEPERSKKTEQRKRNKRSENLTMRLPAALMPFNRPGRRDFTLVLNSRLRNRNRDKKSDAKEDVLFLEVMGQRRCQAILSDAGKPLPRGHKGRHCINCAVDVSDYCYCHSRLQEETEYSSEEEPSNAVEDHYVNDSKRCVAVSSLKQRRCLNRVKPGNKCCYNHLSVENICKEERLSEEYDKSNRLGVRCVAVTVDGSQCRFKAMRNQVVFCPKHMLETPEICFPVGDVIESESEDGSQDDTDENKHADTDDNKPAEMSKQSNEYEKQDGTEENEMPNVEFVKADAGGLADELSHLSSKDVPLTTQCAFENEHGDRCCYEAKSGDTYCRMHTAQHKIETKTDASLSTIDDSFPPLEEPHIRIASSREYRCVFVLESGQCKNHVLPGSVLCPLHWESKKNKKSIFEVDSFRSADDELMEECEADGDLSQAQSSRSSEDNVKRKDDTDEDESIESDHDSSDSEYSDLTCSTLPSHSSTGMYTHDEFMNLWKRAEDLIGQDTKQIENSTRVRAANAKMDPKDTSSQSKAQYGRLLPNAMRKLMKIIDLKRGDVFLDIGHGIGNTCLHVSYCIGCEARGIEVVSNRHSIAEVFRSQLHTFNSMSSNPVPIGNVELRLGKLEDPEHTDFLTRGVTKAYVNNFNGVFAERASLPGQTYFLDDYIAGLFGLMQPGAIMITFHALSLGKDIDDANDLRKKRGMRESDNASFFKMEKKLLGPAYKTVKWRDHSGNRSPIYIYKYERLPQSHGDRAVTLCSNPHCENAVNEVPIPASTLNEEGRYVMNHCKCKISPMNLRRRSLDG